ncbi:hypothetical protein POX_d05211 [Penicillium oxalicum]|uniref:HhH-GPD domain-containing protein n=1 Tax=Penicillium oxalicum (strain 114-2 / CGMCC 5302) TaxID=933388 RepID=S8BCG2_PENO1|nr:hypothetical protein POX_d05211 [Penicillium oxalicum]EPS32632.1 hypothetical protein PDE_07592 [Penicillium oxalicum 114-2]KAI2789714.1 hypothetical protein POX_d05211 [Penicillium oxalicum]
MSADLQQKFTEEVERVADVYGRLPLSHAPIDDTMRFKADPSTVLAMVIDALIKSRPISHHLAESTVAGLIEDDYHDIDRLLGTTWEERTNRLKVLGYNRYREQCATNLGALCDLVLEKYDGDLNNLLEEAHEDREEVKALIKEIKGIGDLGAELFLDNVQSIWPSMAPFVDTRSLHTAQEIGLGSNVSAIYAQLEQDPIRMSKFVNGLSNIRLEHKQHEIEEM